ncbi:MAG: efflux RND transporter periplasmic adaptor subunit [Verrucomicrobiales bacterium]
MPVVTAIAEKSEDVVRELSLTGSVTARREARLSSRTAGLVMEVKVDAGSEVEKGDVLVTLDTRLAELGLESIRAEIAREKIELAEARRRAEEARRLAETGGYAKSEAEALKAAAEVREATLRQLEVAEQEQIETIERHRLVAPFGGVIGRKLTEAGEWVPTGTPVLELVDTEKPRFDIQVPQEFVGRVSRAEKVKLRLDAYPDTAIDAAISVLVPVKDNVSRTFLTRLELDDPENLASPGMSGAAALSYRPDESDTVQVPRDAVVRFPDGTVKVWVVSRSGEQATVRSREIETGGSLANFTEILEGLEAGEEVVLQGNEGLREGQPVRLRSPVENTSVLP